MARERGEEVAPTSRNQLHEALGITNAEAAHLGLSDFSDAPDLREDPAAFAAAVATINRERHEQAIAQYLVDRERYEQYLADKAAYEEARQGQGSLAEPEPIAPPDDGVDIFDPREWESGPTSAPEPIAPPDDGVDVFDPREWEYTPEPGAFSTIVAEDSPKEIESVDPFDLDVSQPAPTPDPDEAFSTITHEPDPGRDFNLVEAITAPDEGGEYDYHQTPVSLTVAKLQPSDHLLEEAEAKTFYPHPTPGQTGDALLFESDGARSELVPENPADYLLEEAPPALWTPGGETVHDNDYLLGESDGRRTLAESWPTWLPRGHGSYMGHGERRGAGQSHGDGDGGLLDALTGGAAWMQGHWNRRVVDPHQTALAYGRCAREQLQPRLGGPAGRVHARLRNRPRVNLHDDESLGAPRLRGRLDARDPRNLRPSRRRHVGRLGESLAPGRSRD